MATIREHDNASRRVVEAIEDLLVVSHHAATHLRKHDLATGADALDASVRDAVERPVRIAVVGDFKSGKTSLINGLLGRSVLDTHPTTPTSLSTDVAFGETDAWEAIVEQDGDLYRAEIDEHEYRSLARHRSPSIDDHPVRAFRLTVPSPLLSTGVVLVDTPSISGGISSAVGSQVIGQLAQSQAWIFTADVSQELTAPQLELLELGSELCPVVLVAATKHDLSPEWRRIIDINDAHIASLELERDIAIVPVAPPLRHAARRIGLSELDDESGVPLLTWHLTRTIMETARLESVRVAAAAVARAATELDERLTEELDTIVNGGERAEFLARREETATHLEHITAHWQPAVERARTQFAKHTRRDLEDRMAALRRQVQDDLDDLSADRDWPKVEQAAQAGVNRILIEHLSSIEAELEAAIQELGHTLAIDAAELLNPARLIGADRPGEIASQLDRPDYEPPATTRLQGVLLPARVGITGASAVGLGIGSSILAGTAAIAGIALVPIAAIGSAWWMRDRQRDQQLRPWKQEARNELTRFLTDSQQVIGRASEDVRDEILGSLPDLLTKRIDAIGATMAADADRLTKLADDRARATADVAATHEAARDAVRLVAGHARHLTHRLASPTLELADR